MNPTVATPGMIKKFRNFFILLFVTFQGIMGISAQEVNERINDLVDAQSDYLLKAQSIQNNEPGLVRIVYLIPADSIEKPEYTLALDNAVRHLRIWYYQELGQNKTFNLYDPVVEVYQTPHEALWYSTNPSGDPFVWFWNNVLEDGFALTGGSGGDGNIWVFYIDALNACGQCGGCGGGGRVVISANDLRGLVGLPWIPICPGEGRPYTPCRFVGGMGHELGHALGLSHPPECDEDFPDCWDHDLMMYGYTTYPDAYLNDSSKQILNNSPFIMEANLDGFTFPCSCLDLTDPSMICKGIEKSILCGDSILLEGAYQYTSGIFHDTILVESGPDTILITYLTIEIPPPEVENENIEVCEGEEVPAFVAIGENIRWYSEPGLLNLLHAGDSLITEQTLAGTYQYYATQTYNDCISPAVQVTLTILPRTQSPISLDTACCEGDYLDHFRIPSHYDFIRWYSDPELTNLLNDSENFDISGFTEPGTYVFYATRTLECESLPATYSYTINPLPDAPVVADVSVCEDDPNAILVADGENITWYGAPGCDIFDVRDSQRYKGVEIGNQVWMAENLNYYVPIDSWYYNDDSVSYSKLYGRMYDFEVAHLVCPSGWHLPSLSEWNEMIAFLGGDSIAGGKLKATDTTYWVPPNVGASDEFGFRALPGGYSKDSFYDLGEKAVFWTSTWGYETGRVFEISSDSPAIKEGRLYMWDEGASIRCIKDSVDDPYDIIASGDTLIITDIQTGNLSFYTTQTVAGCEGPLDTVTLQICPLPTINLGRDTTITLDQEIILDIGISDYLYLWSDGSDLSQCTISGSELGPGEHPYWVTITDSNLCSASDTIVITVIDATNTAISMGRNPMVVYPNPAVNYVTVRTMAMGEFTLEITSMNGELIHNNNYFNSTLRLDLSSLSKGVYFITIRSEDFVTTRKIVKI